MSANMNIGQALQAIKLGHRCRRVGWIDRDRWIAYEAQRTAPANQFQSPANQAWAASQIGGVTVVLECVTMKKPCGGIMYGWMPTQTDLTAIDWYIVPVSGLDPYAHTYQK